MFTLRVPATSANLGPGFDCLGLSLDLWNEVSFEEDEQLTYHVTGEGAAELNGSPENLLTASYQRVFDACGEKVKGAKIIAQNHIPLGSGLGSSAAAIVAGMYGANEMLGKPLSWHDMLKLATEIEGHPDNVAPALFGGLVISVSNGEEIITQRYEIPPMTIVIVKPDIHWPTSLARSVLPVSIPRADAVFNLGRVALVVEALRSGDLDLLQKVMEDRLHQPYRLEHIPGGKVAHQTALQFGAAALSGAGPSIIAFVAPNQAEAALVDIAAAFHKDGIKARGWITTPSAHGVHCTR